MPLKNMEAMLCILLSPCRRKKKKGRTGWYVCARMYGMALKMCPRVHDTHGFPLIHLFSPRLICHRDDKLK